MRWRLALLAVSLVALAAATASQPGWSQQTGTVGCDPSPGAFQAASKQVFSFKHWRHGPKRSSVRALRDRAVCVPEAGQIMAHDRKLLRRHHDYRSVAPFRGWSDEGYWLRWLAVPRWVSDAETRQCDAQSTGLARGHCRWTIINEIGACGPYQLNAHTSCDTSSGADKLRHHRVAHSLPRGSWEVGY